MGASRIRSASIAVGTPPADDDIFCMPANPTNA